MARYEVFIPKSAKLSMDMRLRLEADSWVEALKAGLAKVGEGGAAIENVLCDIMEDNSIHVTDATSGRVFQIIELSQSPEASETRAAGSTQPDMPAAEDDFGEVETETELAPQAREVEAADDEFDQLVTQPDLPVAPAADPEPAPITLPPSAKKAPAKEPAPAPVATPKAPRQPTPRAKEVTTTTESGIGRAIDFTSESTADLLEDIFEISDKVNKQPDQRSALYFMLDLAINTVGTDAGSVLLADINSDELSFGAARGPKADEVMGFKVKVGQGIVGFSTEAGVGVAISDATRDPRFYAAISQKIGYPTRSILCVPVQTEERVFGALELINKKANDTFTERDLGLANFIGQQLARYLSRGA